MKKSFKERLANRFGYGKQTQKRNRYESGLVTRLNSSWLTNNQSADAELLNSLNKTRARARDLSINNDYARNYLRSLVTNTIGATGIGFQNKAKKRNGDLDEVNNTITEAAFSDWGNVSNSPDVTGKLSFLDIQKAVLKTVARDGEVIVLIKKNYKNKYKFSLQVLECDYLDETLNKQLENGSSIRMGVEVDQWGKVQAYHLFQNNPADNGWLHSTGQRYIRVPAAEIIHLYDIERVSATRGISWLHSSIQRLYMLQQYEEAELTAARISAAKMGFFESPDGGEQYTGDAVDTDGSIISDVEPGAMETLPAGYKFTAFDPQHPAGNFSPFCKHLLRSIAAGLGVSYVALTGDLSEGNYGNVRAGSILERDNFKVVQNWFMQNFIARVYAEWWAVYLMLPSCPFKVTDADRLFQPKFTARGYQWIDPLKDSKAQAEAIAAGLISRTELLAEQGKDFQEVVEQIAAEHATLAALGLSFDLSNTLVSVETMNSQVDKQEEVQVIKDESVPAEPVKKKVKAK